MMRFYDNLSCDIQLERFCAIMFLSRKKRMNECIQDKACNGLKIWIVACFQI